MINALSLTGLTYCRFQVMLSKSLKSVVIICCSFDLNEEKLSMLDTLIQGFKDKSINGYLSFRCCTC